ncbi:uncharacterized protein LOC142775599 isoform X1 [Rhipicephalus microplus]|uniref:uncharacterized protein LOC142775599 isoform X1 n=1 Tax=Rhipicephalus microplus TaxID=6941 RepID=UPI003F6CB82E
MLMLSLFVCIPKPFHNYLLHHTLTHLSEVHAPLDEMLRVAEDFKRRSPHFPPLFGDRRELTLGSYLRRPCRNVITMHSTTLPCMEKAIEWNPKLEWLQDSREFGLKYSNDDNSTGSEDDIDTSDFSADDESSSNRLGTSVVVHRFFNMIVREIIRDLGEDLDKVCGHQDHVVLKLEKRWLPSLSSSSASSTPKLPQGLSLGDKGHLVATTANAFIENRGFLSGHRVVSALFSAVLRSTSACRWAQQRDFYCTTSRRSWSSVTVTSSAP